MTTQKQDEKKEDQVSKKLNEEEVKALQLVDSDTVWKQHEIIRKTFAPELDKNEWRLFYGMGRSLQANPFTREIMAVKYGSQLNLILGRDFMRRKAQEQNDYDGHHTAAIYSNDKFTVSNGQVNHEYTFTNRGDLVGAYCQVFRKSINRPYHVEVLFSEYYQGAYEDPHTRDVKKKNRWNKDMSENTWDEKPQTMICKVAEAQALRGAFQGVFKGTYDESEQWKNQHVHEQDGDQKPDNKSGSHAKNVLFSDDDVSDANVVDDTDKEERAVMTQKHFEQLSNLVNLIKDTDKRKSFVKRCAEIKYADEVDDMIAEINLMFKNASSGKKQQSKEKTKDQKQSSNADDLFEEDK